VFLKTELWVYVRSTTTRHDPITPRAPRQGEIPRRQGASRHPQKCLGEYVERDINKLVDEVGLFNSEFC
jgi:hypothetical protein